LPQGCDAFLQDDQLSGKSGNVRELTELTASQETSQGHFIVTGCYGMLIYRLLSILVAWSLECVATIMRTCAGIWVVLMEYLVKICYFIWLLRTCPLA